MQYGLLATMSSIGMQAALLITIYFAVNPTTNGCTNDPTLNDEINSNQEGLWLNYVLLHGVCSVVMIARELVPIPSVNTFLEMIIQVATIWQVIILCFTLQFLFIYQPSIHDTCWSEGEVTPLAYQQF
jgi:hypothetical protein